MSTRWGGRSARTCRRQEARPGYALRLTLDVRLQRAAEQALGTASTSRTRTTTGLRTAARSSRSTRATARSSRWPRSPTYKPSVFVGRVDPKKLAAALDDERRANNSALQPRDRRAVPAGIHVEARHGARRHAGARLLRLRLDPVLAVRGLRPRPTEVPELEPVRQPPDDAARGACRVVRHVLLRDREPLLRAGRREPRRACSSGRAASASARRRGSTSAARPRASCPTPDWRKKTFESDWDRAWNPGDSIQLAIGQKDLLVTPLQMAAFYAMLANGGNVVTPYLVSDVEQPGGEGLAARRRCAGFAPTPPQLGGRRPRGARRRPRRPLSRDALRQRHLVGHLRQLLGADLGQDGNRGEGRPAAGLSVPTTSRTSRGGAAGGRRRSRGSSSAPSSRTAGTARPPPLPRRSRCSSATSESRPPHRRSSWTRTDGAESMIEATERPSLRRRRGAPSPRRSRSSAASTGSCSRPPSALVGYGLWVVVRDHALRRARRRELLRRPAGDRGGARRRRALRRGRASRSISHAVTGSSSTARRSR